jgi:hypothetical protein
MRGERAGVAAEERVRERAVAPEDAGEVQPDEELGEAGADRLLRARQGLALEHEPVRERELEIARDQHRRQLAAVGDDADHLDRRHLRLLERREQPVLAPRERLRQLLERVQPPVQLDEPDDVAADPAGRVDEAILRPRLERQRPRQREQRPLVAARDEAILV